MTQPQHQNQFDLDNALLLAASNGRADDLTALLAAGANPAAMRKPGWKTAFLLAAEFGQIECLKFLAPVSDPKQTSAAKRTALMLAAGAARPDLESVLFLTTVCDVDAVCGNGQTALMHALGSSAANKADIVQALAARTKAIDQAGANGATALHDAVLADLATQVAFFVPRANPNLQNKQGQTALMMALEFGADAWIEALAPVTDWGLKDKAGQYAFDIAVDAQLWEWADAFAEKTPEGRVQKTFKRAGREKMPRWAALMEARALGKEIAELSPEATGAKEARKPRSL